MGLHWTVRVIKVTSKMASKNSLEGLLLLRELRHVIHCTRHKWVQGYAGFGSCIGANFLGAKKVSIIIWMQCITHEIHKNAEPNGKPSFFSMDIREFAETRTIFVRDFFYYLIDCRSQ